jgi:Flp pilus assembly protein TadD
MFRRIGEYESAMSQFTKVQEMTPADKNVYFERGVVYQLVGNHELAIQDLN